MASMTVAAPAAVTDKGESLIIPDDRVRVGLEATWEISALCELARGLAEDVGHTLEQTELMRLALQLRGVVLRVERLNSALMALLGDDEATADLHRKVFGFRQPKEVSHG